MRYVLGIGLLLSHYGLSTYALPALGKAYLDDAVLQGSRIWNSS